LAGEGLPCESMNVNDGSLGLGESYGRRSALSSPPFRHSCLSIHRPCFPFSFYLFSFFFVTSPSLLFPHTIYQGLWELSLIDFRKVETLLSSIAKRQGLFHHCVRAAIDSIGISHVSSSTISHHQPSERGTGQRTWRNRHHSNYYPQSIDCKRGCCTKGKECPTYRWNCSCYKQ